MVYYWPAVRGLSTWHLQTLVPPLPQYAAEAVELLLRSVPGNPGSGAVEKEVYYAIEATRDSEFIKQRKMRGSVFGSLLAVASARLLGDDEFETYLSDVVLDATVIEILTYGTTKESIIYHHNWTRAEVTITAMRRA